MQLWLEWLKMLEEEEKLKNLAVDRLSKFLGREKMYFTRSSWVFTKALWIPSYKTFSARL